MRFVAAASALALMAGLVAGEARADTTNTPPGAPCIPGGGNATGNPCNGNNGNPGPQGNANGRGHVVIDRNPPAFTIARPGDARGAYIDQIGGGNDAAIRQNDPGQYARIVQAGAANFAATDQSGRGGHYARIEQSGDMNQMRLAQSGSADQVALMVQRGDGNVLSVTQEGDLASGGVEAIQFGNDNLMSIAQNGDGNQARLIQNGSGNAMTAVQNGDNNQLSWTQNGNNLSDLGITQNGGQAIAVTQSR